MTSGSGSKGFQQRRSTKVLCGFLALLMLGVWGVAGTPKVASAATQTLAAPTNLAPDGGIDAGPNPVLTWSPVSGAAYYKVNFPKTDGNPTSTTVYATSYAPTSDFPVGTVSWSVTAYDSSGNFSPAESASFNNAAADGPTLNCPASPVNYPVKAPTFTWGSLPNVKNYTLLVSTSQTFLPGSTTAYVTQATSFTLTKGQSDNQTYYARVTGTSAGGINTPPSPTCQYSVVWSKGTTGFNDAIPNLVSPTNNASLRDVVLKWSPMQGAARYEVEVSGNGDWTNGLLYDIVTDASTWSPAKTLDNASYFWRVRGIDNAGNFSLWSDSPPGTSMTFNVVPLAAPTLMSPADGAQLSNPDFKLSWAPVPGAGAYELQVSTSSSFTDAGTNQSCFTTHTDWSPYVSVSGSVPGPGGGNGCPLNRLDQRGLTDAPTLYWHVRAIDDFTTGELASPWNTTQFTNQTNNPPTNRAFVSTWSSPRTLYFNRDVPFASNPSSSTVPTLKWTQVPGTEYYKVTVSTSPWGWNKTDQVCKPGTGSSTKTYNTTSLSMTPSLLSTPRKTKVLSNPGPGYDDSPCPVSVSWTVQSVDHDKRVSPLPGDLSFTWAGYSAGGTNNGSVALTSPSPADGATVNTTPSFAWQPVAGADHYEVWWFDNPADPTGTPLINYSAGSDQQNPLTEAFTPVQPLPVASSPGAWQVFAIGAGGGTIASSPKRLLTVAPPDAVTITSLSTNTQAGTVAKCVTSTGCSLPATPLITWARNDNASYYRVYIAQDPDFTNVVRVLETGQTNIRSVDALLDLQAGQAYYVFVQPALDDWYTGTNSTGTIYGDNGAAVRAGQRWSFQKQSAAVTGLKTIDPTSTVGGVSKNACDDAPNKTVVSDAPTFCWNPSQLVPYASGDVGAMRYHIQISTSEDFGNIIDQAYVDQASYTPYVSSVSGSNNPGTGSYKPGSVASSIKDFTYPDGPLYWRVQAVDATNNALTYSATAGANIGGVPQLRKTSAAVTLTGPANGASVGSTPSLTWQPKPFASQYYVEVYKNGDTSFSANNLIFHQYTDLTAITPTYNNNITNGGQSLPAGDYVWRVRGVDAKGNSGAWPTARTFTVAPSKPSLITPTNGQVFTQLSGLTFTWTPVAGAVQYRLYVSTNNPPSSSPKVNITTVSNAWSVNQKLPYLNYYWQVQALDGQGRMLSESATNTFNYSAIYPFTTAARCISRLYSDLQGSAPTSGDVNTWTANLTNGSKSCADLAYYLWQRQAFQDLFPIARLYQAYFLRIPDYGGMNYWIGLHRGPKQFKTSSMSDYFSGSAEFKQRYGSLSNAQFVTLVYQNVLGRQNDPAGYSYWLNKLNTKRISRGQLMLLFSESAEYTVGQMPTIKAELLVLEFLRRDPTQPEVNSYSAKMSSASSSDAQVLDQISGIMATPAYKARAN